MLCHDAPGMDLRFLAAFGTTGITSVIPVKAGIQESGTRGGSLQYSPSTLFPIFSTFPFEGEGITQRSPLAIIRGSKGCN